MGFLKTAGGVTPREGGKGISGVLVTKVSRGVLNTNEWEVPIATEGVGSAEFPRGERGAQYQGGEGA